LGVVPYLNAKPLVYALEKSPREDVTLVSEVPSRLAALLKQGDLDAALLSSWVCLAEPDLEPVPGLAIASEGPVQSIKLFTKVHLSQVRRVALDTSSLTSVALTRILFQERFGLTPEYLDHPPDLAAMLRAADAALLIGDPGLVQHFRATQGLDTPIFDVLDLGRAWTDWTGLPFVFAVWTARREVLSTSLPDILHQAHQESMALLPEIAAAESHRLGLPGEVCEYYLRYVIRYDLGERERAGLQRFGELARKVGIL
jgi:chorismate dehydratase